MSESVLPAGVLPPIPTAFDADGGLDREGFAHNLRQWDATDLAGYVVCGSNGESVHLSDEESVECFRLAKATTDKFLIAGTGRPSTRHTIELTRAAANAGVKAALIVPPAYYRSAMNETVLETHYRAIADAVPIPVVLYYVPKFAPVEFSPSLVARLSEHPNIAGIKDTSGNPAFLATILRDTSPGFRVYAGLGSHLFASTCLGAHGGILALANVAPRRCVRIFEGTRAGRFDESRAEQTALLDVNAAVTARFGVAGLKCALEHLGYRVGAPRPPLLPLEGDGRNAVLRALSEAGIESAEDG